MMTSAARDVSPHAPVLRPSISGEMRRSEGGAMEVVGIVLSVGREHVETFERGFREQELPVWQDLLSRGHLERAYLNRLDISSAAVEGAQQYLVVAVFKTGEGHHEHDQHPGFQAWNERADTYQVAPAMAFGGETIVHVAETAGPSAA
jgi:hypothetical protein